MIKSVRGRRMYVMFAKLFSLIEDFGHAVLARYRCDIKARVFFSLAAISLARSEISKADFSRWI